MDSNWLYRLWVAAWWVVIAIVLSLHFCSPVHAADIPLAAKAQQRTLMRTAHAQWGLDAPVATFAAQIHQESAWRPGAQSVVGAQGLAQFMPATADWIVELYPELNTVEPYNPAWSMRAMVLYDQWLYARLKADTGCDRWAMLLSAYNGGLGWVLRDKTQAVAAGDSRWLWWDNVERHNAGRSVANFSENRDYARRILGRHEPVYVAAGWGRGVCAARFSL